MSYSQTVKLTTARIIIRTWIQVAFYAFYCDVVAT